MVSRGFQTVIPGKDPRLCQNAPWGRYLSLDDVLVLRPGRLSTWGDDQRRPLGELRTSYHVIFGESLDPPSRPFIADPILSPRLHDCNLSAIYSMLA